jgi:hypothetical protein
LIGTAFTVKERLQPSPEANLVIVATMIHTAVLLEYPQDIAYVIMEGVNNIFGALNGNQNINYKKLGYAIISGLNALHGGLSRDAAIAAGNRAIQENKVGGGVSAISNYTGINIGFVSEAIRSPTVIALQEDINKTLSKIKYTNLEAKEILNNSNNGVYTTKLVRNTEFSTELNTLIYDPTNIKINNLQVLSVIYHESIFRYILTLSNNPANPQPGNFDPTPTEPQYSNEYIELRRKILQDNKLKIKEDIIDELLIKILL